MFRQFELPKRCQAFFLHLMGSATIAILVLILVFHVWYPAPLDKALNVAEIFLILLAVDVTLGPLLTLLIFKPGKKNLMLDMTVILVLQLSALCSGVWVVAEGRPAWVVFNADRFDVVQVADIDRRQLEQAEPQYRTASWSGPRWVAAARPQDSKERLNIMFEATLYGKDIAQRPNFYRSLDQMTNEIAQRAQPIEALYRFNNEDAVQNVMTGWPKATAWLPLKARAKPMVVLLGKNNREIIAIVDLNPW